MVLYMVASRYVGLFGLRYRVFGDGRWRHLRSDVSLWWAVWLGGDAMRFWGDIHPTRDMLAELRLRARRCRAWFNELSRSQRNLMELVIAVVKEKVRSLFLAKLLAPIVKKLLDAMGGIQALIGEIAYKMETVGLRLAQKLSQIAQAWGNKSAARWPEDKGFVQFLTIMDKHKPP
jgi:hypothetical protein